MFSLEKSTSTGSKVAILRGMATRVWLLAMFLGGCGTDSASHCAQANCCRSSSDCHQRFEQCYAPGQTIGCGACILPTSDCQSDGDCALKGANMICANAGGCACMPVLICQQGCADNAGCGEGLACGADHRCAPKTCAGAADCPQNYDCKSGACARRTCTSDDVCSGACVNGACYPTEGFCSAPAA